MSSIGKSHKSDGMFTSLIRTLHDHNRTFHSYIGKFTRLIGTFTTIIGTFHVQHISSQNSIRTMQKAILRLSLAHSGQI